jgi:hypothetical protein
MNRDAHTYQHHVPPDKEGATRKGRPAKGYLCTFLK